MLSERATTEYRLGYYAEAARLYEDAYRAWNEPALLYNIGQAYRMNRESAKAIVAYRSYVRAAPPGAPDIDLARRRIEELEASASPSLVVVPPLAPGGPAPSTSAASLIASVSSEPSAARRPAASAEPGAARRWWWWGGLGALVAGAIVTGVLLANRAPEESRGSVGSAIVP
jgi:tetratricopeptide (TPR) repeat protein